MHGRERERETGLEKETKLKTLVGYRLCNMDSSFQPKYPSRHNLTQDIGVPAGHLQLV